MFNGSICDRKSQLSGILTEPLNPRAYQKRACSLPSPPHPTPTLYAGIPLKLFNLDLQNLSPLSLSCNSTRRSKRNKVGLLPEVFLLQIQWKTKIPAISLIICVCVFLAINYILSYLILSYKGWKGYLWIGHALYIKDGSLQVTSSHDLPLKYDVNVIFASD